MTHYDTLWYIMTYYDTHNVTYMYMYMYIHVILIYMYITCSSHSPEAVDNIMSYSSTQHREQRIATKSSHTPYCSTHITTLQHNNIETRV